MLSTLRGVAAASFIASLHLTASVAAPAELSKAPTARIFCESLGSGTYSGIEAIPDVLGMRACAWLKAGLIHDGNEPDLMRAASVGKGAPGSPPWVKAFTSAGDRYFAEGESAEAAGEKKAAREGFESAAHFYYLARWPHIFSAEAGAAYEKHIAAYRRAARYLDPPILELEIPFEESTIIGHLRVPESTVPLPLIVLSPGIDDWKGEMNDFIEPMLEAGFATLVIDLPGTGQSTIKLAAGSHRVFSAAIAYAKQLPGIDEDRIGFYGLSGGGYFAVAMALTDPHVRAVVNVGGPVHRSFTREWLTVTPDSIFVTLARCAGYNPRNQDKDSIIEAMKPISLAEQGLLLPRKDPRHLLTINGQRDILADPTEYQLIDDLGIDQDMLIFERDGHVAPAHFDIHIPFSIAWLQKKLGR